MVLVDNIIYSSWKSKAVRHIKLLWESLDKFYVIIKKLIAHELMCSRYKYANCSRHIQKFTSNVLNIYNFYLRYCLQYMISLLFISVWIRHWITKCTHRVILSNKPKRISYSKECIHIPRNFNPSKTFVYHYSILLCTSKLFFMR